MSEIPRLIILALSIGFFISLWRNYLRTAFGQILTRMEKRIFNVYSTIQPYGNWSPSGFEHKSNA